jgi:putative NADPH-quinone reductase
VKAYVVYCHPDPDSFTSVVRDRSIAALQLAGHDVRVSDLYAEGFEPAMTLEEVRDHLGPPERKPGVAGYCDNLRWCDALVLIYPTWWSGQPAMLKGWLDRVLIRGVAWELPDGATRISRRLTNVRTLIAVTTHGSSRLINLLEGETGRHVVGKAVRVLCHRSARTMWLALYGIDRSTQAQREAFLERVSRKLGRV